MSYIWNDIMARITEKSFQIIVNSVNQPRGAKSRHQFETNPKAKNNHSHPQ